MTSIRIDSSNIKAAIPPKGVILTEVPIISHAKDYDDDSCRRYIIEHDLSLSRYSDSTHIHDTCIWGGHDGQWRSQVQGVSASTYANGTLLRTCANVEQPTIISISMLSFMDVSRKESHFVEVDFGRLNNIIAVASIVKTCIFHERNFDDSELNNIWKVLLIDSKGNILILRFDDESLTPLPSSSSPVEHVSSLSLIQACNGEKNISHPGFTLSSAQIAFLDSTRVLLAMTPHLMCIHLPSSSKKSITRWTESSCLEQRRKSWGGFLKTTQGIWMGKLSSEIDYDDNSDSWDGEENDAMPSTAAICTINDQNDVVEEDSSEDYIDSQHTATAVISLHSDGTIRMWGLPPNVTHQAVQPLCMRFLFDPEAVAQGDSCMPPPHTWSSSHDSVSLTANLYSNEGLKKFVLSVYIRTADNLSINEDSSPCHMILFDGELSSCIEGKTKHNFVKMAVPDEVESLVEMEFTREIQNGHPWQLIVLYNTIPLNEEERIQTFRPYAYHDRSKLQKVELALYHPGSICPFHIENSHTFDSVAETDRQTLEQECKVFLESVSKYEDENIELPELSFEKEIQDINAWYMKRLFRSSSVRIIDGSHPSHGCIRRATVKVFPSRRFESNQGDCSIEEETLTTMTLWAKFDETMALTDARWCKNGVTNETPNAPKIMSKKNSPTTIYHAFQASASPVYTENQIDDVIDVAQEAIDENVVQGMERRIISHHERWRKLLLAILDEESKLRIPLSITSLPKETMEGECAVLVRAGVTSTFLLSPLTGGADNAMSRSTTLDNIALGMLHEIQRYPSSSSHLRLSEIELQVWDIVSRAKLALPVGKRIVDTLVSTTLNDLSFYALRDLEDKIFNVVDSMTSNEIEDWLKSPLPLASSVEIACQASVGPGLPFLKQIIGGHFKVDKSHKIAKCATAVVLQYVESIRQLTLSRCLLVIGMSNDDRFSSFGLQQVNESLRTYFHATAVIWVNTQVATHSDTSKRNINSSGSKVPLVRTLIHNSRDECIDPAVGSPLSTEPLKSRQRQPIRDENSTKQTVLYFNLLKLAEEKQYFPSCPSSAFSVISLAQAFVGIVFGDKASFESEKSFVELRAIPNELVEKARYDLRLLAPYISYSPNMKDKNELYSRYEVVADCLLTEVDVLIRNHSLSLQEVRDLRKRASNLLAVRGPNIDSFMPNDMTIFVDVLTDVPNSDYQTDGTTVEHYNTLLAEMLQYIVDPTITSVRDEIILLSKMQTMKKLFLPWIVKAQLANARVIDLLTDHLFESFVDPEKIIQHVVIVFLRISNLMRRVSVLECHGVTAFGTPAMKDAGAELIISAINDVIKTIKEQFTPNVFETFIEEYTTLWSSIFRHAIFGRRWDEAFKASLSNPMKERRVKNFQRMVLAMVNAGKLGDLIKKILFPFANTGADFTGSCVQITNKTGGEINLYELAVDTLVDAATRQSVHGDPSPKVNYIGCLYVLHAANGDWRRCCHAMDFYGILSLPHFDVNQEKEHLISSDLTASEQKNLSMKSVDALSLSALACAQFIQLVGNKSHRFIVSCELGSQPALFRDCEYTEPTSPVNRLAKRRLNGTTPPQPPTDEDANNPDRLSYLFTEHDLTIRAARICGIKTLFMDSLSPDSLLEILLSSDTEIMETLSRLGYYSQTIALAQAKHGARQGGCPGGRDILVDSISFLTCQCLAPATVRLSRPIPSNKITDDNRFEMFNEILNDTLQVRPTLNQIHMMSSRIPISIGYESWRSQEQSENVARGAALMQLIRKFVLLYSSSSNSFALELAGTLLDLDSGLAELPLWLTKILIGNACGSEDNGLFASIGESKGSNFSNPAALVRLLMKRGLYVQASLVVCSVLIGKGNDNEKRAPSRLPEKGNIDFVPYDTIDMLWNLIQEESYSESCNPKRKKNLLRARDEMERALEKHFELMKISETGLLSARALRSY